MFLNPHNKPQQWFLIQISFQGFQENEDETLALASRQETQTR